MNVYGYVRESTKFQAENGFNLEDQKRKIQSYFDAFYSKNDRLTIIDDGGFSGKDLNRKGMKNLLALIEREKVDVIIIHNLDRLTRSVRDLAYLLDLFGKRDVSLVSLNEKLDTSSAAGKMVAYILAVIAEWEISINSERTTRAYLECFRQGKWAFAKNTVPVGYKKAENKKLVVDKKGKALVNKFFSFVAYESNNIEEMVYWLEAHKWPKYINPKQPQIGKIISNQLYLGRFEKYGEKFIDFCEPIISEELFDDANKALKFRQHDTVNTFVYHGKVHCLNDKRVMAQQISYNNQGTKYFYYVCFDCKKRVNERLIDEELDRILNRKKYTLKSLLNHSTKKKRKALNSILKLTKECDPKDRNLYLEYANKISKEIDEEIKKIKLTSDFKYNYLSLSKSDKILVFSSLFKKVNIRFIGNTKIIIPILKIDRVKYFKK